MYVSMRRMLLALVLVGMIGLMLELFLLEHTESVWQAIPFVILAGGLAAGLAVWIRPTRRTVRWFQLVMGVCALAGVLGVYLHYRGNLEFELELDASARGAVLVWRSLRGATPALAPAALTQVGLLGLIVAYRHPVFDSRAAATREEPSARTNAEA